MGKKYRHPTKISSASRAPEQPPETHQAAAPRVQIPTIATMILLLVFSVALPSWTLRELRSEILVRQGNQFNSTIDLERAVKLDPYEPEARQSLARQLIAEEKTKFQMMQFSLAEPDDLENAVRLLKENLPSYDFRPESLRLRGETGQMLSELYAKMGEKERSSQWAQESYENFLEAARELPRPQSRSELYNAAIVLAAQRVGEQAVAAEFLLRMDREGERAIINRHGMLKNATQGWFALGLLPQQLREFRYALVEQPANRTLLDSMRLAATQLGQRPSVLRTLEYLKDEGRLNNEGESLLEELRDSSSSTLQSGEDTHG